MEGAPGIGDGERVVTMLEEEWGWDVRFPGGCNRMAIERSGVEDMCQGDIRGRNWKRGYGKDWTVPGEYNGKKESARVENSRRIECDQMNGRSLKLLQINQDQSLWLTPIRETPHLKYNLETLKLDPDLFA